MIAPDSAMSGFSEHDGMKMDSARPRRRSALVRNCQDAFSNHDEESVKHFLKTFRRYAHAVMRVCFVD
jgi:hypothetical protein